MNEPQWTIRFKVKDRGKSITKKKSVLFNLNVTVPTETLPFIFRAIEHKLYQLTPSHKDVYEE